MQTIFANEERLNEVLQLVRRATGRGLNITQQIMDYAKIGQQQAGGQSVDLNDLILNIINESGQEFTSQGVVVECQLDQHSLRVTGDEDHFYSIVKNLILNARDAVIDPGLTEGKERQIDIKSTLKGNTCTVVIADTGVGIAEENLLKIFEPFFSTKPATGTGLGLGMVKKMLSLYDGTIDVSSELSEGTTVTISLPISAPAESFALALTGD